MSGLVVIRDIDDAPVEARLLSRASDAAWWRGADGCGLWVGPGIGLAHRRTEVTPEEVGVEQPLLSSDGRYWIVWDGRLDYREELIAAMGPSASRKASDPALVVSAYAKWGIECVEHIEGDFAFAIWDVREHRLLCARDRFGVRPFHYHWDGRRFAGASETVQLLEAGVSDALDDWMLLRILAGHFGEQEQTVYRGIKHLPPAHVLVLEKGDIRQWRYWSPDPGKRLRYRDRQMAGEEFLSLFRGAVHTRMRALGPVAAHLSGGLDSSSIVCIAAEQQARSGDTAMTGLLALSATYSGFKACDEGAYVGAVCEKTGVAYHSVSCDGVWPLDPPETPLVFGGEPSLVSSDAFNRRVMTHVSQLGSRVLLSGFGGDELMWTGPVFLADLVAQGQVRRFRREINRQRGQSQRLQLVRDYAFQPLLPSWLTDAMRDIEMWRRADYLPPWIRVDGLDRWRLVRAPWLVNQPRRFAYRHAAARFLSTTWGLIPGVAALYEDATFPYAVETRYPFLDARLLEYLMALPPEAVGQIGDGRCFHRRALKGVLPEAVRLRRDKANFMDVYHQSLKDHKVSEIREILRAPQLRRLSYFDVDGARRWYEQYLRSDTLEPHRFWAVFALENWLVQYDARSSRKLVPSVC